MKDERQDISESKGVACSDGVGDGRMVRHYARADLNLGRFDALFHQQRLVCLLFDEHGVQFHRMAILELQQLGHFVWF
jgi:hypothetical protein